MVLEGQRTPSLRGGVPSRVRPGRAVGERRPGSGQGQRRAVSRKEAAGTADRKRPGVQAEAWLLVHGHSTLAWCDVTWDLAWDWRGGGGQWFRL